MIFGKDTYCAALSAGIIPSGLGLDDAIISKEIQRSMTLQPFIRVAAPTVKVSQAPIASSAARTIKTAPPRCPAAGVPLIF